MLDANTMHFIRDALAHADEMNTKALPKFNWGASALDGEAISLLNDAPARVKRALAIVDQWLSIPASAEDDGAYEREMSDAANEFRAVER